MADKNNDYLNSSIDTDGHPIKEKPKSNWDLFKPSNKVGGINIDDRRIISSPDNPFSDYGMDTSRGRNRRFLGDNFSFAGGLDSNEIKAYSQTGLEQTAKGLGKIGLTLGAEVAKAPGYFAGFGAAGVAWATGASKDDIVNLAFNNAYVRLIRDAEAYVDENALSIHVKKAVEEGGLGTQLTSWAVLMNEFAPMIGYAAAIAAPGGIAKMLPKMMSVSRGVNSAVKAAKGNSITGSIPGVQRLGTISAENIAHVGNAISSTIIDGSSEAWSAGEQYEMQLNEMLNMGEINEEEYESLLENRSNVIANTFKSNVAILLVPSFMKSKMLWGRPSNVRKFTRGMTPGQLKDVGEKSLLKYAAGVAGLQSISSAFEISNQTAARTYFVDNPESDTSDFFLDYIPTYLDVMGTTEGQKAAAFGLMLGIPRGIKGARSQAKHETSTVLNLYEDIARGDINLSFNTFQGDLYQRDKNGEILKDNEGNDLFKTSELLESVDGLKGMGLLEAMYKISTEKGDTNSAEHYRALMMSDFLNQFISHGELGVDVLKDYLENNPQIAERAERNGRGLSEEVNILMDQANSVLKAIKDFSHLDNREFGRDNKYSDTVIANYNKRRLSNLIGIRTMKFTSQTTKNEAENNIRTLSDELGLDFNNIISDKSYRDKYKDNARLQELYKTYEVADRNLKDSNLVEMSHWSKAATNRDLLITEYIESLSELSNDATVQNAFAGAMSNIADAVNNKNNEDVKSAVEAFNEIVDFLKDDNSSETYKEAINTFKRVVDEYAKDSLREFNKLERENKKRAVEKQKEEYAENKRILDKELNSFKDYTAKLINENVSKGHVVPVHNSISSKFNSEGKSELSNDNYHKYEIVNITNNSVEFMEINSGFKFTLELTTKELSKYNKPKSKKGSLLNSIFNIFNNTNIGTERLEINSTYINAVKTKFGIRSKEFRYTLLKTRDKLDTLLSRKELLTKESLALRDLINEEIEANLNIDETSPDYVVYPTERMRERYNNVSKELLEVEKEYNKLKGTLESFAIEAYRNESEINNIDNFIKSKRKELEDLNRKLKKTKKHILIRGFRGNVVNRVNNLEYKQIQSRLNDLDKVFKEALIDSRKIKNLSYNSFIKALNINEPYKLYNKISEFNEMFLSQEAEGQNIIDPISNESSNPISNKVNKNEVEESRTNQEVVEVVKDTNKEVEVVDNTNIIEKQTTSGKDELSATEGPTIQTSFEDNANILGEAITEPTRQDSGATVVGVYLPSLKDGGKGTPTILTGYSSEKVLSYERNGKSKVGDNVSFSINTDMSGDLYRNVYDIYNKLENGESITESEKNILISNLPIRVHFAEGVESPLLTKGLPSQQVIRTNIVEALINGESLDNINTKISYQYGGSLQQSPIVDGKVPENNILELQQLLDLGSNEKSLQYIHDNLYYSLGGKLVSVKSKARSEVFNLNPRSRGEIYLMVNTANGTNFPLKLNISRVNEESAKGLSEIYKGLVEGSLNEDSNLLEIEGNEDINNLIEEYGRTLKDNVSKINPLELINHFILTNTTSEKSNISYNENGVIVNGELIPIDSNFTNNLSEYLINNKRRSISFDNINDSENGKNYLKEIINSKVLNTDALTNEPLFQGYTSMFLDSNVTSTRESYSVNYRYGGKDATTERLVHIDKDTGELYILNKNRTSRTNINNVSEKVRNETILREFLRVTKEKVKTVDVNIDGVNRKFTVVNYMGNPIVIELTNNTNRYKGIGSKDKYYDSILKSYFTENISKPVQDSIINTLSERGNKVDLSSLPKLNTEYGIVSIPNLSHTLWNDNGVWKKGNGHKISDNLNNFLDAYTRLQNNEGSDSIHLVSAGGGEYLFAVLDGGERVILMDIFSASDKSEEMYGTELKSDSGGYKIAIESYNKIKETSTPQEGRQTNTLVSEPSIDINTLKDVATLDKPIPIDNEVREVVSEDTSSIDVTSDSIIDQNPPKGDFKIDYFTNLGLQDRAEGTFRYVDGKFKQVTDDGLIDVPFEMTGMLKSYALSKIDTPLEIYDPHLEIEGLSIVMFDNNPNNMFIYGVYGGNVKGEANITNLNNQHLDNIKNRDASNKNRPKPTTGQGVEGIKESKDISPKVEEVVVNKIEDKPSKPNDYSKKDVEVSISKLMTNGINMTNPSLIDIFNLMNNGKFNEAYLKAEEMIKCL